MSSAGVAAVDRASVGADRHPSAVKGADPFMATMQAGPSIVVGDTVLVKGPPSQVSRKLLWTGRGFLPGLGYIVKFAPAASAGLGGLRQCRSNPVHNYAPLAYTSESCESDD